MKPNILFILSDQHRYDCIGYANKYPVKTPNIDRIAEEGMWFKNAFTPIPLCCPARQALINGRRPEAFGALWNYDCALKIPALEPEEYSWVRELKKQDFKTGYVGKWHVNPTHNPTDYGFDDYIEHEYGEFRRRKYPDISLKNDWLGEEDPVDVEDSHTHWLADQTIGLINKYSNEEKPWHIRLDFPEPHLPCQPAGRFAKMYSPQEVPKWGNFDETFLNKPYIQKQQLYNWDYENFTWEDWAPTVARYYGIISQMDDAIGKVLDELDRLGIADNTIVIYSTDHGDMCGAHRMMDKHYVLYEDIVKVPLIIRWPGKVKGGSCCEDFVYNILDLPPTLLEILGVELKEFFHGRSLLPILEGQTPEDWKTQVMCTYNGQQFGLYIQRMLRDNKWKYIWNPTDIDELYDLETDPYELDNRIYDVNCKNIIADMRKRLLDEMLAVKDGMVTNSVWMRNQLLNGKKI